MVYNHGTLVKTGQVCYYKLRLKKTTGLGWSGKESLSKKLYDSTLCSAKSVKSQSVLDLKAVFAFIFTDQL